MRPQHRASVIQAVRWKRRRTMWRYRCGPHPRRLHKGVANELLGGLTPSNTGIVSAVGVMRERRTLRQAEQRSNRAYGWLRWDTSSWRRLWFILVLLRGLCVELYAAPTERSLIPHMRQC